MKKGSILGVDLNEKSCQISYYDENKEEPETMEAAVDNYQIPLILGYYKDRWVYGQEAKRLKEAGEGDIVTQNPSLKEILKTSPSKTTSKKHTSYSDAETIAL